jgi:hypothetical protein
MDDLPKVDKSLDVETEAVNFFVFFQVKTEIVRDQFGNNLIF